MAALIVLLPISAAPSSLAHRPGHIVPLSRMAQYHSTRTVWHDMIGRHYPIFAVIRERYSRADLFGVTVKVVDMPNKYLELHPASVKKLGSATMAQTYSCKIHLVKAVRDRCGFRILCSRCIRADTFVHSSYFWFYNHLGKNYHGFVMETVAERTIPAGGVAKVE